MSISSRKKTGSVSGSVNGGSSIFSPPTFTMPNMANGGSPAVGGIPAGGEGANGIGMQMGNTLAAKTASLANPQTMYQMCVDIRKRLRRVKGYAKFLETPPSATRLDTVNHVWLSFRLGSSLCHLFNMLLPIFEADPSPPQPIAIEFPDFDFPEEHGVLTWGSLPANVKQCKRGAAKFIMTLTNLRREGKWPEHDTLWAIHELFLDDTGGLVKVLRTISILLDRLPITAWIQYESDSPATPHPVERTSSNGSMEAYMLSGAAMRPPSAASTHFPSHRSQLSTASSHGGPRGGYETPPIQGTMSSGGVSRGTGLSINTSLDRAKSYTGSHGHAGGHDPAAYGPLSAHPQLEARQGDARPVDFGQAAMQVWEILKTEKKYVQELEILQAYSQSLLQHSLVAPDTVHLIFSNLSKLVDFQRRFLTQLETEYEPVVENGGGAWKEGNWGFPWIQFEKDFEVYEPYCANYLNAIQLIETEKDNLDRMKLSLSTSELPAFVILPIQRICKYPLLLQNLVESSASTDYAFKAELARGFAISKRIADAVNETLRQHSNLGLVEELKSRVKDWKGHAVADFGKLLLDGQFIITKSEQDRDYSIYLFERMILCCKEVIPEKKDKRSGKSGSLLKKQTGMDRASSGGPPKKNPLSLKGRIYVNNLTAVEKTTDANGDYALKIMWRQQEDPAGYEFFIMHIKSSETVNKWDTEIKKLMLADAKRREERERRSLQRDRSTPLNPYQYIPASANFAMTPSSDRMHKTSMSGDYFGGDDDTVRQQWEDDGVLSCSSVTNTPNSISAARRGMSGQGFPDRYSERMSNDMPYGAMPQWQRAQQETPTLPPLPRTVSSSVTEQGSNGHYRSGSRNGYGALGRHVEDDRPGGLPYLAEAGEEVLRPTMALGNARYTNNSGSQMQRSGSGAQDMSVPQPHPAALRLRSASSPNVYQIPTLGSQQSQGPSPPVPGSTNMTPAGSNQSWMSMRNELPRVDNDFGNRNFGPSALSLTATSEDNGADFAKRASNSSQSTELSEVSSHSPETPYGGNIEIGRRSRVGSGESSSARSVIIKVRFNHNIFKLAVPSDIDCVSLKDRVIRKVRLCGSQRKDDKYKCYYMDEDQERLRLDADDDLITLFDPILSGSAREVELEVNELE